jgi:hypothetical protein
VLGEDVLEKLKDFSRKYHLRRSVSHAWHTRQINRAIRESYAVCGLRQLFQCQKWMVRIRSKWDKYENWICPIQSSVAQFSGWVSAFWLDVTSTAARKALVFARCFAVVSCNEHHLFQFRF